MTKGRCKSKVPSQESSIIPVDEGLPLESGSDCEGGALAAAAAQVATAAQEGEAVFKLESKSVRLLEISE